MTKKSIATTLAKAHVRLDPSVKKVIRIVSSQEASQSEPIKLLEVSEHTIPTGIMPIGFGAAPPDVPYPSVIVEITLDEYKKLKSKRLSLPRGWKLAEILYEASAAS